MAEHDSALGAARVILAGVVLIIRESGAVGLRSRQNVMPVWCVAATIVDLAFFGQGGLFGEVVSAVQFGDVLCNCHTFCVHPRTLADTVARVDRPGTLCRQVGMPSLRSRAGR